MTEFSEESRVWVYQSNRAFKTEELPRLQSELDDFCRQWTAHNQQLKAKAEIRYMRFIVLMVDESMANTTGCSIDKSVHFLHELEKEFNLSLFDRMLFTYKEDDRINSVDRNGFEEMMKNGLIDERTTVFNNLVTTKKELDHNWEVPLENSWHKQFFAL